MVFFIKVSQNCILTRYELSLRKEAEMAHQAQFYSVVDFRSIEAAISARQIFLGTGFIMVGIL